MLHQQTIEDELPPVDREFCQKWALQIYSAIELFRRAFNHGTKWVLTHGGADTPTYRRLLQVSLVLAADIVCEASGTDVYDVVADVKKQISLGSFYVKGRLH